MTVDRWSNRTSQSFENILRIKAFDDLYSYCILEHTIFRCRLKDRIFFKSLIDTLGSISLLINRILFAINTVLQIQSIIRIFLLQKFSYRNETLVNPPFFPGKHRYTPTTWTRSPGYFEEKLSIPIKEGRSIILCIDRRDQHQQ